MPLLGFCQFNVPRAHHEHQRAPTSATGQLPASDDRVPEHVALRFRCFVPRLRSAGSPVARGDCRAPHRGYSASHWAIPRVRGTEALTPTSTTAHRGGFTPAGGGPDTSCHQLMIGSVWKSGSNVGAVARLPDGNQPVNMLDRSRARLRVARRASSRNENRGAYPRCLPSPHRSTGCL